MGTGAFIPDVFDMPYEYKFIPCPLIAAQASYMAMGSHARVADAARGSQPDPLEPPIPPPQLGPETMEAVLTSHAVARFRGARATARRARAMPPRSSNVHMITSGPGRQMVRGRAWMDITHFSTLELKNSVDNVCYGKFADGHWSRWIPCGYAWGPQGLLCDVWMLARQYVK